MRKRILIVSARVGAGHDGAARELGRRLSDHDVHYADFLDLLPGRLGPLLCAVYHRQLRFAPRTWDWVLDGLGSATGSSVTVRAAALAGPGMLAAATPEPDLVVSTYPLASHTLAHLRATGRLRVPFAVYLTDPAVHRLSVCPASDLHIAPTATAAQQARDLGAGWVEPAAPVVDPRFGPAEQAPARAAFGLPAFGRLALVVAGSWGVGKVSLIARDVARSGAAVPVVVCGRNKSLARRLRRAGYPHVLGWVTDMPRLIQACDVVVQNAGGLTTSEALATGRPVLTYRCLPGHGRLNAEAMDVEGVVPWIRDESALAPALAANPVAHPLAGQDPILLLHKLITAMAAA